MFRAAGASGPAFPSIIGSGENTCILHYTENNNPCAAGDLMVVDIGAEYQGYAADVTRTIPVDGTYSPAQKAIYELVLEAQAKGFEACQKGNPFSEPGKRATEVIANGLVKLGIIAKTSEVKTYFIHGTSHYLGLDVHDAGNYDKLSPGNVITVEPGIYIPVGSPCDSKWWNIGVRIEDDVLILEKGYEVLSEKAPRSVAEIEKIMQAESFFNNKPDFLIK
jgi:Xaa-Pro aminopeptidase